MPLVKQIGQYEFRFHSRGEARERPHIHVRRERSYAKFWLDIVACASWQGFPDHELNRVERLVRENREEFLEAWYDTFA